MTRYEQPQSPDAAQIDPDCDPENVVLDDENCPPEPTEPEEGDITTEDHEIFYQYGKVVLSTHVDDDWKMLLRSFMNDEQFWPNVWWISDHGNAHLIDMSEKEGR